MTKDEALNLALEGLEHAGYLTEPEGEHGCTCLICQATIAVKEALAQPEQEPFDYKEHAEGLQRDYDLLLAEYNELKAQRKPLTDEEIVEIYTKWESTKGTSWADLIRAIEAAHGIKGET